MSRPRRGRTGRAAPILLPLLVPLVALVIPATVAARPTEPADLRITLVPIAEGLDRPTFVTHAGDGSGTLYVTEQVGRIRVVTPGVGLRPEPYLDISDRIITESVEQGLLGLAFHPRFPEDGRLYVSYTRLADDALVVSEYQATTEAADVSTERILLAIPKVLPTHNGGMIAFDPDGRLVVGMGDGGYGDPPTRAEQDPDALYGKLFRLDVDTAEEYAGVRGEGGPWPEVLATGLRNPWRFSIDAEQDVIFIGDVGQWTWEEVDVLRRGEPTVDFGWSDVEGPVCSPIASCDVTASRPPALAYDHDPDGAVIGGYAYRGGREPLLEGRYVFADLSHAQVMVATVADLLAGAAEPRVAATGVHVRSFGEDEAGELLAVSADGVLEVHAEAAPVAGPGGARPPRSQIATSVSLLRDISQVVIRPPEGRPPASDDLGLFDAHDVQVAPASIGCGVVTPTGPDPYVRFQVGAEEALTVVPSVDGQLEVFLVQPAVPSISQRRRLPIVRGQLLEVSLPGRPADEPVLLRLDVPMDGDTTVCRVRPA